MNAWLRHSPFLAVGIYISGDSRGCRSPAQPDPDLGHHPAAQGLAAAADHPRPAGLLQHPVPAVRQRRDHQPQPGTQREVPRARVQGRAEAVKAVHAAQALGHRAAQHALVRPRGLRPHPAPAAASRPSPSSAAGRLQAARLDYVSGVYSSVGSGIKILDDARVNRPDAFNLPDRSGWPGGTARPTPARRTSATTAGGPVAGSSSTRAATTRPGVASPSTSTATSSTSAGARGHGREDHCDGTRVSLPQLPASRARRRPTPALVRALQCLLQERGTVRRSGHGHRTTRALRSAIRAWQRSARLRGPDVWSRSQLDVAADRRRGPDPEVRVGRAGGAPSPAGAQRRLRRAELRVDGRLREASTGVALPRLPEAGGRAGRRHRRAVDVDRPCAPAGADSG